jgi:L-ascorbate metabolism protein UlaG (beta-lactamase superfamily)
MVPKEYVESFPLPKRKAHQSFHADGGTEGTVFVYEYETDDLSICNLGDLGHQLSAAQVEQLQNCDILMVPVGGVYTVNGTGRGNCPPDYA